MATGRGFQNSRAPSQGEYAAQQRQDALEAKRSARRLALRTIRFSVKERAYDLWSLTLPIFLVMGVLTGSARLWVWVFFRW